MYSKAEKRESKGRTVVIRLQKPGNIILPFNWKSELKNSKLQKNTQLTINFVLKC